MNFRRVVFWRRGAQRGDFGMRWAKNLLVFFIGAVGYGTVELIWRGYTHPSMLLAGGICFLLFSYIAEKIKTQPLITCAFLCALAVTAVELLFGIVFNIILKMEVWDYGDMPFNLFGQICPTFFLLWCSLALFCFPLARRINSIFI